MGPQYIRFILPHMADEGKGSGVIFDLKTQVYCCLIQHACQKQLTCLNGESNLIMNSSILAAFIAQRSSSIGIKQTIIMCHLFIWVPHTSVINNFYNLEHVCSSPPSTEINKLEHELLRPTLDISQSRCQD